MFFSCTTGQNALIFSREHSGGQEIQVCSNEVPGVTNGYVLRGPIFIQVYIAETFKNLFFMNHWPTSIDI